MDGVARLTSPRGAALGVARSAVSGLAAALVLLGMYLGIITVAQGWSHAVQQLRGDAWFVGAILLGFGAQVALFMEVRRQHAHAASSGMGASTGTSTVAMLACCAHHVADVLPLLGLSGAAIFLDAYKTPLLWLGIAMNAFGTAYLTRQLLRQRGHAPRLAQELRGGVET